MDYQLSKRYILALLVVSIACSVTITAHKPVVSTSSYISSSSSINHDTLSSQQQQQQQRVRLPRRLSSRQHNELGPTESGRKSSPHMLIGGHLRVEPTETTESGTTKTESTLEDGLLLSSAGNGKEKKSTTSSESSSSSDDDDKKTLSQQVKEGKYGLIQNELFAERPKRPGIISYSSNAEVPRDNIKSLGGLDEDEIWLAEDHVLVLKGGGFPKSEEEPGQQEPSWRPIDDYEAPQRQVKIPARPRVPPPFPVQLTEGGPVQLIGSNGSSVVDNGTIILEALPEGFRGFLPGEGPYFPLQQSPSPDVSEAPPERKTKAEKSGPPAPLYGSLPPGAVIVPPPSNQTDYDDEDQSIYYPPPYSFVYAQDNSTDIPPGPLVPGIILPPPPDFFSPLDDKRPTNPSKGKYGKSPDTTITPLIGKSGYSSPRKSSTKIYKTPSVTSTPLGSKTATYHTKFVSRHKYKNSTYQPYLHPEKTTSRTYSSLLPFVEVTTPAPLKATTLESPNKYQHLQPVLSNQVIESSSEKPWRSVVSSKPVPLVTFYASTTPSSIEQPVETTPSAVKHVLTTEPPTRYPSQASYYFYEEAAGGADDNQPSSTPEPVVFFSTTAETPPYYKLELESREQPSQQSEQPSQAPQPEELEVVEEEERSQKKDYYDVEMIPSQQTSKDYNVKLIDSIVKDPQIYRYIDSGATSSQDKFEATAVRNQSPRMLHSEPLYYQPVPSRPSPKLSYFTSPKPKAYYRRPEAEEAYSYSGKPSNKPKPIYQYSFEANNYKQEREAAGLSQKTQITEPLHQPRPRLQTQPRRQKELPIYAEYQDIQSVGDGQYDYEGSEPVADQQPRTEKLPYLSSPKKERPYYRQPQPQPQSTTASPVRETTLASHQQYFTKQDEQLLDEVTKEYFTMFGKKLSGKLPSTTPIYGKSSVTERPSLVSPSYSKSYNSPSTAFRSPQNVRVHYGDHTPGPYSLKDDILINYKHPLPAIEPEAEFISVLGPTPRPLPAIGPKYHTRPAALLQVQPGRLHGYSNPSVHQRYEQPLNDYNNDHQHQQQQRPQTITQGHFESSFRPSRPLSLAADLNVNYKEPRPGLEPEAEFVPGGASLTSRLDTKPPNSYFAYRLPGDGGHFYFLTPQAISREDPNAGYLYARPRGSRLLRRRRARDND